GRPGHRRGPHVRARRGRHRRAARGRRRGRALSGPMRIPILLYHSVSVRPPACVRPFSVAPSAFAEHLDALTRSGCTPLTVSDLVGALDDPARLPERPVAITFDDGWADFVVAAA